MDMHVFDLYFSSLCAFQMHPGVKRRLSLRCLSDFAILMVLEREDALMRLKAESGNGFTIKELIHG